MLSILEGDKACATKGLHEARPQHLKRPSVWLITIRSPVQACMGPFAIAVAGFVEGVRKGSAGALGVVCRAGWLWNLVHMFAIYSLATARCVSSDDSEAQQTGSGEERHRQMRPQCTEDLQRVMPRFPGIAGGKQLEEVRRSQPLGIVGKGQGSCHAEGAPGLASKQRRALPRLALTEWALSHRLRPLGQTILINKP